MLKMMRIYFCLCIMFTATLAQAYESTPVVNPAEVLPPELLKSLRHRVKDVEVRNGMFHFYLESDFGGYYIDSMALLRERVREVIILGNAISHTGSAEDGIQARTGNQLEIRSDDALDIVKRPVKSATELAGQVAGSLNQTLGGQARPVKRDLIYGGSESSDPVMALHKRNAAGQWQLDIYSTNPRVQAFLESVARARSSGNISAGTPALNRLPVKPLKVADTALELELSHLLKARSAADLNDLNRHILVGLNIDDDRRNGFLQQPVLSPRHKTRISEYLQQLAGVDNLSAFFNTANSTRSENEALACEELAMMLVKYHKSGPGLRELLPATTGIDAVTVDNRLLHFAVQDMIYWDQISEQFYDDFTARAKRGGFTRLQVINSGLVTQEAKDELLKRTIDIRDRYVF